MAKRSGKRKVASGAIAKKVAATNVRVQAPPPWYRRDWLWGLMLILSVLLAYAPIWHAGFIWDDDVVLTANPCIVGPLGLKEIWTTNAADICPLTITTFWFEHALWGLEPVPYHLVNVLMHGACAVLLWRVLRSLRAAGAWLGAALWALHPVAVESVAWTTEMKNTESCLFFLLSTLFFVKWVRTKALNSERTGFYWAYPLSLLFAALAMASKSSTVILPVVLCLCAWWIEGRWHWRNLARVMPVFVMSLAAGAVSIWTQGLQLAAAPDPQWVRTWPQRLAAAGDAVWFYLGKLVWPDPLNTVYPRWQIDAGQWISYLPLLAVILLFSILWLNRQSWARACFFAFAYFMSALLPELGLIDTFIFRFSLVFDHFQYLASIGPLALAGAGLARSADLVFLKRLSWLRPAVCSGLLVIFGIATRQRAEVFQSEERLWSDTLAKYPDCWVGYNNLGDALLQKGQVGEAVAEFQKALEIYPNYPAGHYNLGVALFRGGEFDDAIAQFRAAIEINPNYTEARTDLGLALVQKELLDEAIEQYQIALKINPNFVLAHANLGMAFFKQGKLDDAIVQFQEALRLKPDFEPVRDSLRKAEALERQK